MEEAERDARAEANKAARRRLNTARMALDREYALWLLLLVVLLLGIALNMWLEGVFWCALPKARTLDRQRRSLLTPRLGPCGGTAS